jgi:adenylate cyclase
MKHLGRLTLAQLFVLTTFAVALAVGATFYAFLESSRRSIVERSDTLRDSEAVRIGARLSAELAVASTALENTEGAMHFGALAVDDPIALETRLFSELLSHPTLSDMSLTHGTLLGHRAGGEAQIAPGDRWQISVFRASADAKSEIITRRITVEDGHFVAYVRSRPRGGGLFAAPFLREAQAADPTLHPTFETTVSERVYGRVIWSDLSFSELDSALPQADRRVVVTVQKAVEDTPGRFAGVLRVGLVTEQIDSLPRLDTTGSQRVFLSDAEGRLVARLDPRDHVELTGDDLRIRAAQMRPEVAAALASPNLRDLSKARPERSDRLRVGGASYLATFRALENSQGWVVGIVVPEDYYTGDLRALQRRFFTAILLVTAIVLIAGGFVLHQLRRSLGRVIYATGRMRRFDFSASPVDAPLREMAEVMEGVERAKTAMRALGKYVPIDLVRELYQSNREPELGGELVEISLMFSDIEGFTSLSERMAPDALAQLLGRYLEAMTKGVRSTEGTVDKFIGDSVMAFWNAPARRKDHPALACRAVLACMREAQELYASPAWNGFAPLFTRFGLHRTQAMVGHFGAPERLSYTALGDGVNLASRLEGLCKVYGVAVLASEAIVNRVGDEFCFRFIDRVAVKGKAQSVRVYELLGIPADCRGALARAKTYERALLAYLDRDFSRALDILGPLGDDPPSRVLASRCNAMIAHPPPPEWDGVYVATAK